MIKTRTADNAWLRMLFFAFLGTILCLAPAACEKRSEEPSNALAIINGRPITLSEFELRWSQLPEFARQKYVGSEGRKQFLEELIDRELLVQEAQKRGLDRDHALVDRVERFKERGMMDSLVRQEVDSQVSAQPEEIKGYYDANRKSFTEPVEYRVSHILVRTQTEAADVKKRLDRGEDFAILARKLSIDTSTKSKGGDLGVLKKGQTVPAFEKELMNLKPGEISGPVATEFGYHLIKLVDRTEGPSLSFEDAKEQARAQVLVEKKQKRFKELISALRAKAKVRVSNGPIPAQTPSSSAIPAADAQ